MGNGMVLHLWVECWEEDGCADHVGEMVVGYEVYQIRVCIL